MDEKKEDKGKFVKGFTIEEIENTAKKYSIELCLCVIFALTAIFALIWGGASLSWSILLCMIFSIIGCIIPEYIEKGANYVLGFIYKEIATTITIGVIGVLLSIFLPPVIFAIVGIFAGKALAFGSHTKMKKD